MKGVFLFAVAASLACYADVTVMTKRLGSIKASENVVIGVTGGGGGDISPAIAYTTAVSNKMEIAKTNAYTKSEADGRFVQGEYDLERSVWDITVDGSEWADVAGEVNWLNIEEKPTTLSGYGITDAKIEDGTITLGTVDGVPQTIMPIQVVCPYYSNYTADWDPTIQGQFKFNSSVQIVNTLDGGEIYGLSFIKGSDPVVYGITTNSATAHETVDLDPWGVDLLSQARADNVSKITNLVDAIYANSDLPAATNGTAKTALKRDIPSAYLASATSTDNSITVTPNTGAATTLTVNYEYGLRSVSAPATVTCVSGEIVTATGINGTLNVVFPAEVENKSADFIVRVVTTGASQLGTLTISGGGTVTPEWLCDALTTTGKIAANKTTIICFSKVAANTYIINAQEVK